MEVKGGTKDSSLTRPKFMIIYEHLTGAVMKQTYCPDLKRMPLSQIFSALADPVRLMILLKLIEKKELSCGECTVDLPKSTMSHHFKVLRETGLIQRREEGKLHFISLREKEIEERVPGLLKSLKKLRKPL